MLGKSLIKAAAGNAGAAGLGIEDVFSTWLYTGNGSTQTITNGIDLAGEGGLVWLKCRAGTSSGAHVLCDTARGVSKSLSSNSSAAEYSGTSYGVTAFNSNGFSLNSSNLWDNSSLATYASWTFRKAPGFFDVVTYTGTGSTPQNVPHNLGSIPGCIIVKRTDLDSDWNVYHRSTGAGGWLQLNKTDPLATILPGPWNNTAPTTTEFTVINSLTNASGGTYVAYLFAHDEQIFGDAGDQSVIKCGSYTGNGSFIEIDCGWEAQWVLVKRTDNTGSWVITDNMRGLTVSDAASYGLFPNLSNAEADSVYYPGSSAKGFTFGSSGTGGAYNASGGTYIYIAIRRGPMKTPTSGTEVFNTLSESGTSSARNVTAGFPVDTFLIKDRTALTGPGAVGSNAFFDRLRGNSKYLRTESTAAEAGPTAGYECLFNSIQTGVNVGVNYSSYAYREYAFRRAPGFFDVVAYTGTGSARTVPHNLGVAPELMIVKCRSTGYGWRIYDAFNGPTKGLAFYDAASSASSTYWNDTAPTSNLFTVSTNSTVNTVSDTYIAYLFATLPGISKVFSFTGNGTSQTINCGFTSGARFVLVKRTDSTGNWLVADTARGIVSGNDPLLYLNSTAAEITTLDWIDPDSSGFIVNQEATANANVNGATYIGLAIS